VSEGVPTVVRVLPDVTAIDREFDYLVPPELGALAVGTLVRVPLQGRSVRGWVVATDAVPVAPAARLLPIKKVVGAGPPPDVVALCDWAAWRFAGPRAALLRAASPPNAVRDPAPASPTDPVVAPSRELLAWPPAADRRGLVARRVAPEGSTLVLVPEHARLAALVRHLTAAGHRVHTLRGDDPDALRTRAWAAARAGRCVVVGGRSAVWAPVPDLAAVVVLDESEEALQEERAPTWHARTVAAERARRAGAALTLVGPVPTVDAVALAGPPARPDRAEERAGWPRVEVVDPRAEAPGAGMLTEALARALQQTLAGTARAVCVLNRKGRARVLACAACQELARCERCGAAVMEADGNLLECPSCATRRPLVCLHCHGSRFKRLRPGVARLRDDLAALLPRTEIAEVEASTETVPDVPVLVGTEAVLHRIPRGDPVRLVAFLDFDQELLAPRYRAAEQAGTLLARAARVVGPRAAGGRVLVQTRLPDHEVLQAAAASDPTRLLAVEQERRAALGYPPFGGLVEVSGVPEAVRALLDLLRERPTLAILGPTAAGAGLRALVRADTVDELVNALGLAAPVARAEGRLRIAVDPPRV
jgi:primosomal protein N' (replication factor Y)